MSEKDNPDTDDDMALFRQAMKGVRPLQHDGIEPVRKRPRPIPKKRLEDEQQVLLDMMSDDFPVDEVENGEELLFARDGVQQNIIRKLRRGQISIEAQLDLHGYKVDEARQALSDFLHRVQSRGIRCVRIIHGKGHGSFQKKPVLKNKVNVWLRQRDEVLAFTSTPQVDGGTGAVYVLIRRK
jgi:DNA-nicking Smr family endonuclease